MILRTLLESFIESGMVIVTTSNRHPDDLYLNGIQRNSFIPCIELIKSSLEIIHLTSLKDYRERYAEINQAGSKRFFFNSDNEFNELLTKFCSNLEPVQLNVFGRSINISKGKLGHCAKFTFNELFTESKSAADYIEITKSFPKLFINEIPKITKNMRNEIRRLITFIDQVYDSKVDYFQLH